MALGESVARAGLKKLVMVTSHGGNSAAMMLVAQDLRAQHKHARGHHQLVALRHAGGTVFRRELRHGIHGGAVETSIMLARYPQAVREEAIADFPSAAARDGKAVSLALHATARRRSPGRRRISTPAAPSATRAWPSAEKGEQLLDHGARAFCELLADVDNFDVNRLAAGPLG